MNIYFKLNAMTLFFIVWSVLMLTACGMQGDLYLPEESTDNSTSGINKGS